MTLTLPISYAARHALECGLADACLPVTMTVLLHECSNTLLLAFDGPPPEPFAAWAMGANVAPLLQEALFPAVPALPNAALPSGQAARASGARLPAQGLASSPSASEPKAGGMDMGLSLESQAALAARTAALLPTATREAQAGRLVLPAPLPLLRTRVAPDMRPLVGLSAEVRGRGSRHSKWLGSRDQPLSVCHLANDMLGATGMQAGTFFIFYPRRLLGGNPPYPLACASAVRFQATYVYARRMWAWSVSPRSTASATCCRRVRRTRRCTACWAGSSAKASAAARLADGCLPARARQAL